MFTLFSDDVRAAYLSGDLDAVQALCAPLALISSMLDEEEESIESAPTMTAPTTY